MKIIGVIIAVLLIVSIGSYVFAFVLPGSNSETAEDDEIVNGTDNTNDSGNDTNDSSQEQQQQISIFYQDEYYNYTLNELEQLELFTGSGRIQKLGFLPDIIINPPLEEDAAEYSGVKLTTLFIDAFKDLKEPESYNVTVVASDDYSINFTKENIHGDIELRSEQGEPIIESTLDVHMVLAWIEEGNSIIDTEDGPFRIVFIGEDDPITSSKYWMKQVVELIVTET